jgi:hypothetical protein
MQNDKTYFALVPHSRGYIKKVYPQTVYKCNYDGIELFAHSEKIGEWVITEKTTGLPIAISHTSKIEAMQRARDSVSNQGRDKILDDIKLASRAIEQTDIYEEINE